MNICTCCKKELEDEDLRPYGPGGSLICYPCGTATPEMEEATFKNMSAQFDAAVESGDGNVILTNNGPIPLTINRNKLH